MISNCKLVIIYFFFSGMLLLSCQKEENRTKELLQQQDWKQLTILPWDSSYAEHKFFHTLRFRADNTYFMETNWSLYDVLMYTETGPYEFNAGDARILFPEAIDTIDEGSLYLRIYLSPWQILQIDDTLMIVRSEPDYQPPAGLVRFYDDTLYFRPKE